LCVNGYIRSQDTGIDLFHISDWNGNECIQKVCYIKEEEGWRKLNKELHNLYSSPNILG
jgi:hypothetical protein